MQIIPWHWKLNENPVLASWKRREPGISSPQKRSTNNGLKKEGLQKKKKVEPSAFPSPLHAYKKAIQARCMHLLN